MCKHEAFKAKVDINRISDTGRFMADVTINCSQCGEPFQFIGLEPGLNMNGAAVSLDGIEARMAILPTSQAMSPLERMMATPQ